MAKRGANRRDTGGNPTPKAFQEAQRIISLHPEQQRHHPSAIPADLSKLAHINTYGELPEYYIDRPFLCRQCNKPQIWKAVDQKWYYEEAKGHTDAFAVECRKCRQKRKSGAANE